MLDLIDLIDLGDLDVGRDGANATNKRQDKILLLRIGFRAVVVQNTMESNKDECRLGVLQCQFYSCMYI